MTSTILQPDMGEFFDFANASANESSSSSNQSSPSQTSSNPAQPRARCPIHSDREDCLCRQFINDFGFKPEDIATIPSHATDAENLVNFSQWVPRFSRPQQACDYCHDKQLDCYFTRVDQRDCSCCKALFRECSFSSGPKNNVVMDILSSVNEDSCCTQGGLTGTAALRSWNRSALDGSADDDTGRKSGTRFSRATIKILKDWMDQHRNNPYPTDEEKEMLCQRTELNQKQITDWMANTRRRSKAKAPRGVSHSVRSFHIGTPAVDIPFDKASIRHNGKTWDIMNPLERYLESPPENEPAPITVISKNADQVLSSQSPTSSSNSSQQLRTKNSSSGSDFNSARRPASITSFGTGTRLSDSLRSSNSLSNLSLNSSRSGSRLSHSSLGSGVRKEKRRRRRTAANPGRKQPVEVRPFQCTFCTDTFRTKYDWARHEKSLHISLEKWICSPIGAVINIDAGGQRQCVFCGEMDPTPEHAEMHNYRACEEKGRASRTFFRKDHLRQHLRLVHGCKMTESMDMWKVEVNNIKSRCGFCATEFTTWNERVDHIAKHYKAGADMEQWKGCRGFDPNVASQITNAMPPYLIGNEKKSPYPFSASNTASMYQQSQYVGVGTDLEASIHQGAGWPLEVDPNFGTTADEQQKNRQIMYALGDPSFGAGIIMPEDRDLDTAVDEVSKWDPTSGRFTQSSRAATGWPSSQGRTIRVSVCWEILTLRLGRYVKEQLASGVVPTDAALQRQARWILFEDDDSWNQTAADNAEWLELFKKAHGISNNEPGQQPTHPLQQTLDVSAQGHLDSMEALRNAYGQQQLSEGQIDVFAQEQASAMVMSPFTTTTTPEQRQFALCNESSSLTPEWHFDLGFNQPQLSNQPSLSSSQEVDSLLASLINIDAPLVHDSTTTAFSDSTSAAFPSATSLPPTTTIGMGYDTFGAPSTFDEVSTSYRSNTATQYGFDSFDLGAPMDGLSSMTTTGASGDDSFHTGMTATALPPQVGPSGLSALFDTMQTD